MSAGSVSPVDGRKALRLLIAFAMALATGMALAGPTSLVGGSCPVGYGPRFTTADVAALANGNWVLADSAIPALLLIESSTGNRRVLAGHGVGAGPDLVASPISLAVEHDGGLLMLNGGKAVRVDPVTGDRSVVSDLVMSEYPDNRDHPTWRAIAAMPGGDIVVGGRRYSGDYAMGIFYTPIIARFDLRTGQHEIVFEGDCADPLNDPDCTIASIGQIVIDSNGGFFVEFERRLMRVDPGNDFWEPVPGTTGVEFITIAVDVDGSIIAWLSNGSIVRVDPTGGRASVVSDESIGTGVTLKSIRAVSATERGILAASDLSVILIDPASGNRSVVSGDSDNEPALIEPVEHSVVVEPWGTLVAIAKRYEAFGEHNDRTLLRIDSETGLTSVLSGPAVGAGPNFYCLRDLSVRNDGMILVNDSCSGVRYCHTDTPESCWGWPPVYSIKAVNPDTGDRSFLINSTGSLWDADWSGLDSDDGGLLLVREGNRIVLIDPAGPSTAVVSAPNVGTGPSLSDSPGEHVINDAGSLIAVDGPQAALFRVSLVTGDREILSDDSTGSGPPLVGPHGIARLEDDKLVVTDSGLDAVIVVDSFTGCRRQCKTDPLTAT